MCLLCHPERSRGISNFASASEERKRRPLPPSLPTDRQFDELRWKAAQQRRTPNLLASLVKARDVSTALDMTSLDLDKTLPR